MLLTSFIIHGTLHLQCLNPVNNGDPFHNFRPFRTGSYNISVDDYWYVRWTAYIWGLEMKTIFVSDDYYQSQGYTPTLVVLHFIYFYYIFWRSIYCFVFMYINACMYQYLFFFQRGLLRHWERNTSAVNWKFKHIDFICKTVISAEG